MFELKPLHHDAVPAALEKANRYRLLNEPGAAESIYLDILAIEPDNQEAIVNIVLSMSDRFVKDYAVGEGRIQDFLAKIEGEYERAYYTGIVYERRAKAVLEKGGINAFELFEQAMEWFEKAEAIRPRAMTTPYFAGTAVPALSNETNSSLVSFPQATCSNSPRPSN